jgi:hypothetical protein
MRLIRGQKVKWGEKEGVTLDAYDGKALIKLKKGRAIVITSVLKMCEPYLTCPQHGFSSEDISITHEAYSHKNKHCTCESCALKKEVEHCIATCNHCKDLAMQKFCTSCGRGPTENGMCTHGYCSSYIGANVQSYKEEKDARIVL